MTNMNFKAAAAVAALSALFLAGCSDGAKTEPSADAASSSGSRSGEDGTFSSTICG